MLKKTIVSIAITLIVVSAVVLLGWLLQIEALTYNVTGLPTMKFNTAFSFMLLAMVIFLNVRKGNMAIPHVVNGILLCLGLLTLYQDIAGVNLGIDQAMVSDLDGILSGNPTPGRMSSVTSLSFILLGVSLLLISVRKPRYLNVAAYLAQSVAFFAFLAMSAFFLQISTVDKISFISSMAVHTAIGFLLASIAISLLIPTYGLTELFIGKKIGSHLMRRLFFQLSVLILALCSSVLLLYRKGLLAPDFSIAILGVAFITSVLFILMVVIPSINQLEKDRRVAEQELHITNTYLNTTPNPMVIIDGSRKILLSNALTKKIFGYAESDLKGKDLSELIAGNFTKEHEEHLKAFHAIQPDPESEHDSLELAQENHVSTMETKLLEKRGKKIPVEITLNSIKAGSGFNTVVAFRDISRTVEAERNYKVANEKVLAALDASIVGVWGYDIEQGNLEWDDNMYNLYGLQREKEEATFALWKKHVHEEDFGRILEQLEDAVKNKSKYEADFRVIWPDGSIHYIRGKGSVLLNEQSEVIRVMGTNWDISTQKNYELALQASTEQNRLFIEEAPTAIAMFDTNMVYLAASKKWLEDYNITQKVIGRSHYDVFPEIDDDWKKIHKECLAGAINTCDEAVFERKDGSKQWITWEVKPWYTHDNEVGGLLIYTANITQFKENVMERLRLQDMLEQSNEIAKIGSWEYDGNKQALACSPITKMIYEVPTDIVPSMESMLSFYDEEESRKLQQAMQDALEKSHSFDMELKLTTAKSNEKWVRIIGRTKGSEADGKVYGIFQDITAMKNYETSLIKAKQKAEAASKSKSEFLANMSHEIRTPLNGIIGFTDLLMKTELSESQQEYMHTVFNSANHLLDIINDVLDFSKIEAGKLELSIEKVDLLELCDQTMDIVKHQAHAKGLEILLDVSSDVDPYVFADSVRLRQVLTNLLGNAVKFTNEGEVELKVRYSPELGKDKTKKCYVFSIRDTGVGIAEHNLEKIFKAFDQEDASTTRKFGGTGLGLTISNRLLNFMGSNLKVESKLNEGSVFSFVIEFETTDGPSKSKKTGSSKVKKVLVIDDNKNNRIILQDILRLYQIEAVLAESGIEALEILEEQKDFDLAIVDYNMPYLNGIEVIQHIRDNFNMGPEILPIMLLHSSVEDGAINNACHRHGVQFNLTKPIMLRQLQSVLDKIGRPQKKIAPESVKKGPEEVSLEELEPTILVAEDNPVNRLLARTLLQKIVPKSTIVEAHDGFEAVKCFEEDKFDFVFMDIQMPLLSGYDATQKIRQMEKGDTRVPIIALTARSIKGEKERCLEHGMDGYVTKPVVYETLKDVLSEYLLSNLLQIMKD
ncbi:response regulator [Flagellimonas meishanensis]|uniref:response regulator n=1 Tax=Flagellimonas meishanensis TaxID=2873264 RepID=UPI001CA6C0AF|nr:response regulator [[Muricauda] meishanensis]